MATPRRNGLAFVWRVCLVAGAACLLLEAATGAWLSMRYRPGAGGWIAVVHRLVAAPLLAFVLAGAVIVVIGAVRRGRFWLAVSMATVSVVAALIAASSGALLPWNQLALWAVTVNSDYAGVWRAAYASSVRFVLIGRFEVTQVEYRVAVLAHLVAAPALVVAAVAGLSRCGPSSRPSVGTPPPSPPYPAPAPPRR